MRYGEGYWGHGNLLQPTLESELLMYHVPTMF